MTILDSEGFESISNGTAITTANTSLDQVGGATVSATTSSPIAGSVSAAVAATFTELLWTPTLSEAYCGGIARIDTFGSSATYFSAVRTGPGGTRIGEARVNTNGSVTIRSNTTGVWTSATGIITAGTAFRWDHYVSSSGNTQTIRLYIGANLNGATPDYDSGAQTANGQGAGGIGAVGISTTSSTGQVLVVDDLAYGDDWTHAPAVVPVADAAYDSVAVTWDTAGAASAMTVDLDGSGTTGASTYGWTADTPGTFTPSGAVASPSWSAASPAAAADAGVQFQLVATSGAGSDTDTVLVAPPTSRSVVQVIPADS